MTSTRGDFVESRFERRARAGEGTRTLDIQLGKLALCQLSYTRTAFILMGADR